MAKRVLSIEIGQQVTKAVVTDYLRKNPHVYNAFSFDTPPEAMEDGYIRDKETIANLLRSQLKDNGVKEKDVVFSIASGKVATREVVLPYVAESKLDDLVHATAQDYFPVNMEEYTLAYHVIDMIKEKDKKSLKLMLLVAPDTLVQNYYSLADEIGLHVEAIDYYGNGSMQVLQKHIGSGYNVCVQIGSLNTMVSVMRENQQIMQRTVPYGINTILDTMMEQSSLELHNATEAMEMLCRENIIYSTLDYEDLESVRSTRMTEDQWKRSHRNREARQAVTDAVGGILYSVIRVVDYFNSKYPDNELVSIYITGMGVKIRGIDVLFEKEMDLPVRRLEKLANITFSRGFAKSLQDQTEYIAVIGAAMDPVGFKLKAITERASHNESMRMARLVFVAGFVVAVALVGLGWFQLHSAETENEDLKDSKSKLEYINAVYKENKEVKAELEEAQALEAATYSHNDALKKLLEDLEKVMPKELRVNNLQVSATDVSLTIQAKRKISAAALLLQLEKLDSLTNLAIPAITSEEQDGSFVYNFTVTANYKISLTGDATENQADSTATTKPAQ